jgi:phage shock protein A
MKRFFTWLKALFNALMYKVEDPMIMIDQAKRDMQESLVKNRERAVQAITQRNNLAAMVKNAEKEIERNKAQAAMALKQRSQYTEGTPEYTKFHQLALQFAKTLAVNEAQLVELKQAEAGANASCDNVKKAIERQESEFKKKLAEASALKAQYKSAEVQNAIAKALEEVNFENINEGFGQAGEKIQNMQSEAAARNEMLNESLAGKVAELEEATADVEAESALANLEKQLGFAPSATVETPATVSVGVGGSADDALNALEQRLGK